MKQPFNFYTFGLDINSSQRVDIMNNIYNRLLEKELIDQQEKVESIEGELGPARSQTAGFMKTQQESEKEIKELRTKYEIAVDDRKEDRK